MLADGQLTTPAASPFVASRFPTGKRSRDERAQNNPTGNRCTHPHRSAGLPGGSGRPGDGLRSRRGGRFAEINADRAWLPICTIAEDLPPTPFARSRPLLAAGGTITDDYPASLKEAYERFRGESEATDGLPVEGGEAEAAQAAANARFEEAIAQFCD